MIEIKNFKSVIQVLDFFKEEETCKQYLEQQRWGHNITCPHCGHDLKIYRTNRGYKCGDKTCHKKFTVTTGTLMESTKIKLRYWFAAIYLITAHKKGISSHQLARDLGVTQTTAWFLNHRIREMMIQTEVQMLENIVEVDETYVGGKRINMHAWKRKELTDKYGTGYKEKTPVLGLLQRDGEVIAHKIPSSDGKTIKPIVKEKVKQGSTLLTDGHGAYADLHKHYDHVIINHDKGVYAVGEYHTNSLEGFWGIFKRGIIGIYHHVSPKHLDRYCNEFTYRYNSRKVTDCTRFELTLTKVKGRLRYQDLIAAA
ncbi:MAG: IS1595 family transposase [Bacteroidetes bacterium]|nr:IS1595 family transposase [Bacteroidota bacterium]